MDTRIATANTGAWRLAKEDPASWFRWLSEDFYAIDAIVPHCLPHISTHSLCCVSDYSRGRPPSQFDVLSYLYLDPFESEKWSTLRSIVRDISLGGFRTMSYKGLNDKQKRRSLEPYLAAANSINGLLLTFAVHRDLQTFRFDQDRYEFWLAPCDPDSKWKRRSLERAIMAANLFAFGASGFSDELTTVTWLTDQDEIVDKPARKSDLRRFAQAAVKRIAEEPPSQVHLETPQETELPRDVAEDLLAIPDLAAAAVANLVNQLFRDGASQNYDSSFETEDFERAKDRLIVRWLLERQNPLAKAMVFLFPDREEGFGLCARIQPTYLITDNPYTPFERTAELARMFESSGRGENV